jgi:hypothetical protein
MSGDPLGSSEGIPEEIRGICTRLCEDVARLHLKWGFYLELFGSLENTALLSATARAFFRTVEESLRTDMILSICRLSDPSRTLGGDNLSLATLVARCGDVPRAEDLLTAFQAACGPVRRHRHRHLGHNDLDAIIEPRQDLLPDVGLAEIEEILQLAAGILRAVHRHYCAGDLGFPLAPIGGARDLIDRLKGVQERAGGREAGSSPGGDSAW